MKSDDGGGDQNDGTLNHRRGKFRRSMSNVMSKATGFTSKSYRDFSKSRKGVTYSLLAIVLYLILCTVVFSQWIEEWNEVEALYFTVVTFTTV